jgi:hypothetical protein
MGVRRAVATDASPEFDKFLALMGEKITLKGFKGYTGGLDIKGARSHCVSCRRGWASADPLLSHAGGMATRSGHHGRRVGVY